MLLELFHSLSNIFYMALHVVNSGSFPKPLSAEEERECLEAFRERGDITARNRLVDTICGWSPTSSRNTTVRSGIRMT